METEAKSSKENKSSFKQAGKQSFGSYPNQPASSQSACQASLLSGWGWQQELAKQSHGERARDRQREKERRSFHYTKTLIILLLPLSLSPSLVLSHRREIPLVKVTDADNFISGRRHSFIMADDSHIFVGGDTKQRISHHHCVSCVCVCVGGLVLSI